MAHKVGRTHVPKPNLQLSDEDLSSIFDALPIGGGTIKKVLGNLVDQRLIKNLIRMRELDFKLKNVASGSKAAQEAVKEQRKLVQEIRDVQFREKMEQLKGMLKNFTKE